MISLVTKPVYRLSTAEIKRCKHLTFVGENVGKAGLMQGQLIRELNKGTKSEAKAILAHDGTKILGWGLVFKTTSSVRRGWHFYMYVQALHRGKGIGKKICGRARSGRKGGVWVYPHDQVAKAAYKKLINEGRVRSAW